MANGDLEIPIGVDTGAAEKGLKSFFGDFKKMSGDASTGLEKFTSGFKTLAAVALGGLAVKEVFGYLKKGVDDALEADKAIRQMNIALASTGEYSAEASSNITEMMDSLADSAGITGEAALSAFSLAKSFSLTNEEAEKVTIAAADLAAATGENLNTAVKNLGGTYNGVVGTLGKTDTAIKALSKTQLENGMAIDIIAGKYRGAASAAADTFGGNMFRLGERIDDVQKSIGYVITQNPAFQGAMRDNANAVADFVGWLDKNRDTFVKWTNIILGALNTLRTGFYAAMTAISQLMTTLFFEPLARVSESLKKLTGSTYGIGDYFIGLRDQMNKNTDGLFDATVASAEYSDSLWNMTKAVDESAKGIQNQEKQAKDSAKALEDLKGSFKELQRELESIEKENAKILQSKEAIAKAENDAAQAMAKRAVAELKLTGENTAANMKVIETYKLAAAEKARLASLPLGSFDKLKDDLSKVNDELQKQGGLTTAISDAEYERSRELIKNTVIELEGLGKLNESTLQLMSAYAEAAEKKRELANIDIVRGQVEKALEAPFQVAISGIAGDGLTKAFQDAAKASVAYFAENPAMARGIAAGVGILGQATQGRAGAKSMISGGLSAAGDAFLPGIGKAIGPLADALMEGPESVKAMATEFADSVPVLVEALVEALPVLVETLASKADVIVMALARAMPKVAMALAIDVPIALAKGAVKAINNLFSTALKMPYEFDPGKIRDGIAKVFNTIMKTVSVKMVGEIVNSFSVAMKSVSKIVTETMQNAFNAVAGFVRQVFIDVGTSFKNIFTDLSQLILAPFEGLIDSINAVSQNFGARIYAAAQYLFNGLVEGLNVMLDGLYEFFKGLDPTGGDGRIGGTIGQIGDMFKGAVKGIMGGGGRGEGLIDDDVPIFGKLAKGGDIPPGFPNDSFPARLTSGEAVITPYTTKRLNSFLDAQEVKGNSEGKLIAVMTQILNELKAGRMVAADINIDGRTLQKTILNLNRRNQRLTV